MAEGLFIVIYGINNIGKSTQVDRLAEKLSEAGLEIYRLKYPVYDLEPTGPKLNQILRSGEAQKLTEEELQDLYVQNRRDYQPQLVKKLLEGVTIIAEDYTGTGIAWGWAKGGDVEKLIEMNKGLTKPDVEILLDGDRFLTGRESKHLHENRDDLVLKCRQNLLELAVRFGWSVVNANQTIEEVEADITLAMQEQIKKLIEQGELSRI